MICCAWQLKQGCGCWCVPLRRLNVNNMTGEYFQDLRRAKSTRGINGRCCSQFKWLLVKDGLRSRKIVIAANPKSTLVRGSNMFFEQGKARCWRMMTRHHLEG
mgnify:CR=1 FL=1